MERKIQRNCFDVNHMANMKRNQDFSLGLKT